MGLSYDDAKRLNLAHLHPLHGTPFAPGAKAQRVPKLNALGQNKTEAAFDQYLAGLKWAGRIADFRFEPFKLRLAGRTYYSPDFAVKRADGSLALLEIKGFMRDDAAAKTKVAAEQFAWLGSFYLVRADRACEAGWDVRAVTRKGFGPAPIGSGWITAP